MTFQFLHLRSYPIFKQLQLEEALLRSEERNWCLINEGSPPAIVMGISGKADELIDIPLVQRDGIPVIRRFSGGGTVVVDEGTLFVTFICQKELHCFPIYPEPIMKWSEMLYKEVFLHKGFQLQENDYAIGEKKCGGNAQYIKKERWLHHTSFLWNFEESNMRYLLHPKRAPAYRKSRSHSDFLCRLFEHLPSKEECLLRLKEALKKRYEIVETTLEEALLSLQKEHRQSTERLFF